MPDRKLLDKLKNILARNDGREAKAIRITEAIRDEGACLERTRPASVPYFPDYEGAHFQGDRWKEDYQRGRRGE
jgi:hypothetical protein